MYKAPPLAELKAKLKACTKITRCCGTTCKVNARTAAGFSAKLERYMDSSNEVDAGSYWPLVKRARAFSSKWEVLQTGAVLVDAPGVHDDNGARDRVVKEHLKDADMIWIVSNINRAVNDKTAKDMLSKQFRSQLLMDGSYGRLCFVATQSDVIQAGEVRSTLHLENDATIAECAAARNHFTTTRIQEDFLSGAPSAHVFAFQPPHSTPLRLPPSAQHTASPCIPPSSSLWCANRSGGDGLRCWGAGGPCITHCQVRAANFHSVLHGFSEVIWHQRCPIGWPCIGVVCC